MAFRDYLDQVQKVYIAYYQRPADPEGLRYWAQRMDVSGGDLKEVIDAFATSEEAQRLYGTIDKDTIGGVVDKIYKALFDREPDAEGRQFYIEGFSKGSFTAGSIVLDILNGARDNDAIAIQNKLEAAQLFTQMLNPKLDGSPSLATYSGKQDEEAAREWLKSVKSDPKTLKTEADVKAFVQSKIADAKDAILEELAQSEQAKSVFTLTQSADAAEANVFLAKPVMSPLGIELQTLNSADNLKGTGVDPTLDILWTGITSSRVAPTLQGIETIKVSNLEDSTFILAADNVIDVKNIEVHGSVGGFTASNLQTKVEKVSITNTATATRIQVANSALSGNNDEVQVVLDKALEGSSLNLDAASGANGYEMIKVKVQNHDSTMDRISTNTASTKTIVFEGDKNLTLKGDGTSAPLSEHFTSIDASAMKGSFTLGAVNVYGGSGAFEASATTKGGVVIKGGSKDDTFVISDLGEKYDIQGGDGMDTLVVTAAAGQMESDIPSFVRTAPKLNSIEILKVVDGDGSAVSGHVGINLTGVSGLKVLELAPGEGDHTKVITLSNLSHNNDFTIKAVGTGEAGAQVFNGVTYNPLGATGPSDKVTIEVGNKGVSMGANHNLTLGNITLSGADHVSMTIKDLSSTSKAYFGTFTANSLTNFDLMIEGGKTEAGSVTFGSALGGGVGTVSTFNLVSDAGVTVTINQKDGASFEINGAGNHEITAGILDHAVAINAAGASGKLTLKGSSKADMIVGGSGDDTITGGEGADQLTGGAGNDTFILSIPSNWDSYATITDASAGDKLVLVDKGSESFNATRISLSGGATFEDYLNVAANSTSAGTNAQIRWFEFNDDTYLVEDMSDEATFQNGVDLVVKLTGIVDLSTATLSGHILTLA
ncbi:MAG: hypothetical protein P3W87_003940 [Gammaproteobacteria bacterium]|nr:hypothetical protein [Gammaproteobacteria bacterium]